MKRSAIPVLTLACGLVLIAFSGCDSGSDPYSAPAPGPISLRRTPVSTTLSFPIFLTAPPGDTARLFVVEKGGRIRIVNRATNALVGTFLDIGNLLTNPLGSEQGLLGLAFDPLYANNGRFYVSYTGASGTSVIARYLVDPNNQDLAVPTADRIILTLAQPYENHNGGMIAFGPDGFLYIGFGDGGSGGDPQNHAQNPDDLLGKLLRIDVSDGAPGQPAYIVPADNPFVGQANKKEEIWSFGLRNPWRWSFDRSTDDLYIADVGQNLREEVNFSSAASGRGRGVNYGWNITEGTLCFLPSSGCNVSGLTLPNLDYTHLEGCSITGGYVYRGTAIPALQGTYFYADYCAGFVRSFKMTNGQVSDQFSWAALSGGNIVSFGEDVAGELYILTAGGGLYRIESN